MLSKKKLSLPVAQ